MDYVREELLRQRQALAALLSGGTEEDQETAEAENRAAESSPDPGTGAGTWTREALAAAAVRWMAETLGSAAAWETPEAGASAVAPVEPAPAERLEDPSSPEALSGGAAAAVQARLAQALLERIASGEEAESPLPAKTRAGAMSGPAGSADREAVAAEAGRGAVEGSSALTRRSGAVSRQDPAATLGGSAQWTASQGGGTDRAVLAAAAQGGTELRAVSRAVQRDARRYDGGFSIY